MEISELYKLYTEHPVVTTDSRDCPEGSIFIALKGASFDGNLFAAKALEQGCAYAVIDDAAVFQAQQGTPNAQRFILVDDCLQTYKDLAREHRRQFSIPVIGITGTNGKTTTKELIATVLQEKYNVLYTQGNFNNDVGVPKTLMRLCPEHEIAVIEMGASHPGDIKTLVETVEPTHGLITNVGRAHLLGFGSFEGVMKTKGELYDFLKAAGATVFLHQENTYLSEMARERQFPENRLVRYSSEGDHSCYVSGQSTNASSFVSFQWEEEGQESYTVDSHLVGGYNLANLMTAVCVGRFFGVEPEQINHALRNYTPTNNRSQLEQTAHNTLIVDAYNANPTSMMASLENFCRLEVAGKKMCILGDMKELGDYSADEHQRIVDFLKKSSLEDVWLVGDEFLHTDSQFRTFHDVEEVKTAIAEQQPQGFHILIKGSNSTRLYQLPELL